MYKSSIKYWLVIGCHMLCVFIDMLKALECLILTIFIFSCPDFIPVYKVLGSIPAWGKGDSLIKQEIFFFKDPNCLFEHFTSLPAAERTILQQTNIHPFFFVLSF